MTFALELVDIHKRFGAVVAVAGATLRVQPGSIHAVLGENGAGKTTLVRAAYGLLRPDRGEIRLDGSLVRLQTPSDAIALGVGMVHQHFALVPAMTVAENIALGGRGRYRTAMANRRAGELARTTGLDVDPAARVADLPVAAQQRVEILKAIARDAHLLILDEPTAVLAPSEAEELLAWLRRFTAGGATAVLITHKLAEAQRVADELTVLRNGRSVGTWQREAVDDGLLTTAMLGDTPPSPSTGTGARRPSQEPGEVVLRLDRVSVKDRGRILLTETSLTVRGGEIVGVASVEGSGHHELLRLLAGRLAPATGRCLVPEDVAFIPEDRHRDAVVLSMTIAENVALRRLGARRGLLPWADINHQASRLIREFDIRAPGPHTLVAALSGGNQQRFVVGRECSPLPPAVIAENPTRGLDVRATAAVHGHLRSACQLGSAVVVYSTDLDEILGLADRVLVVHAGTVAEAPRDRAVIGRLMLGLAVA